MALYIFSNDKRKIERLRNSTSSGGFLANDTIVHGGGETIISLVIVNIH